MIALGVTNAVVAVRPHGRRLCASVVAAMLAMVGVTPGWTQQGPSQRSPPPQAERLFDRIQDDARRAERPGAPVPRLQRPGVSGDTRPFFRLNAVSVDGAVAIPAELIAGAYQPFVGRMVSQADLATIAETISDLYRSAGYHLSRAIIPPQDIKGGRLRIRMIEGAITELVLKGPGAEQFGIRAQLGAIVNEHPARLATLERHMLLANALPGVRIADTALEEIGTMSGRFRLIVTVETWRIYMAQGVDNSGTSAIGPWQAYSSTSINSSLVQGDVLALNLATVPDAVREQKFGRLSYDAPIGNNGVLLGASAIFSETRPGDVRRLLDTRTRSDTFEVRASIAPLQAAKSAFWLTAALGVSNVSERDALGTNYDDHLRTATLKADFKLQDDWGGWTYLTVLGRQGFGAFGGSQPDDPLLSRFGASGEFSLLDYTLTRYQKLSEAWSVRASVTGQWASAPLLLSQQFQLGGAAFGPGYFSGDNGIAGLAELRFDQEFRGNALGDLLKAYQLYAFVDGGATWDDGRTISDAVSLASVGAGLRLFLASQTRLGIAVATPIHYRPNDGSVRDLRVLFSLSNSLKFCPERARMNCD